MAPAKKISTTFSLLGEKERSLVKKIHTNALSKTLGLEKDTLNVALNQANAHLRNGMPLRAFEIYSGLVLLDPLNIDVQIGLSHCATELGDHLTAIQAAAAIILTAPADPRGYLLSGKNCLLLGRHQEAREDLEDAQRLAASDSGPLGAEIAREASALIARLDMLAAKE